MLGSRRYKGSTGRLFVERQVQQENIDSRFTEETELSWFSIFLHEGTNGLLAHMPFARNARNLELRRRGCDVGIQA